MAAAIAYNAVFATVPAAFAFFTAISAVTGSDSAQGSVETTLRALLPSRVATDIVGLIDDVQDLVAGREGLIIVLGVLIAMWSASRAIVALQKALARIERHEEHRPAMRVRLIGIGLTIGAASSLLLVSGLIVAGEQLVDFLAELTGVDALRTLRVVLGFPSAAAGVFLTLYAIYRWGPPDPIERAGLAALIATLVAGVASFAFSAYLNWVPVGPFAVLGLVGITLLWLFLTAYVVLLVAAAVGFGSRHVSGTPHPGHDEPPAEAQAPSPDRVGTATDPG